MTVAFSTPPSDAEVLTGGLCWSHRGIEHLPHPAWGLQTQGVAPLVPSRCPALGVGSAQGTISASTPALLSIASRTLSLPCWSPLLCHAQTKTSQSRWAHA